MNRPAQRARLWLVLIGGAIAGCNLAPVYTPPKTDVGVKFKEAVPGQPEEEGWQPADPRDTAMRGQWWKMYGDPRLDELEEQVAVSNQTVVAAEANYRASRALLQEAQASLFPTLSLNPSMTYSRSSASVSSVSGAAVAGGTGTSGTGTGTTTTTASSSAPRTIYSLPLEASYQIDLWGSVRNNVAENRFNAAASAAQVATALLSTQSTLAQDYFQVRLADEERRILDTTLEDFQANLHLVQTLFKNGLDSEEDVAQAETQLQSAMAQATDLGATRATYEHAIAVLIGVPPSRFSLPYQRFEQKLPPIPVGLPADLIERRPDIATAERQVAASNSAIGVARAAYFPQLTISGTAGFESTAISQLLKWPNRFWSIGPTLAQTLFDGGLRRAATAQALALNDQAAANYRQTVLSALQAVEDNLASLRILAQELKQQHAAAAAAQRAVRLSVIRFRNGVDSYVNVITAQNSFLTAREAEVQVELRQLTASVNLINNLGGGWQRSDWSATGQAAMRPPAPGSQTALPANETGDGVPNPPALPVREIRPEEILRHDEETMKP